MNTTKDRISARPKGVGFALAFSLAMTIVAAALQAGAAPLCNGGEVIWDSGHAAGCIFAKSDWDSSTASMCNGSVTLPPTGGDCYVCVDTPFVSTVLNGGTMLTGRTLIGADPQIFYCLSDPGYERLIHGSCVYDAWNTIVSWFPMDETSGSLISDIYSYNDGTIVGASRVAGWIEGGLFFDGINDYVTIPDASDFDFGTSDFSIDFWIKTSQSTGVQSILDKRTSGPYRGWHVYTYRGNVGLQLADGGYSNYTSAAHVADGSWHHVAITVDRSSTSGLKFFLDGSQVGSSFNPTARTGSLSNSSPLRIAARSLNLSGFWNGTLDEFGVHWGAMAPATIADLADTTSRGKCD